MKIKYFLFGAAALALGACSNDENVAPEAGETYVRVTVQLPTGGATRSDTNSDGTTDEGEEEGQTTENTIKTVQVVLVNGSNVIKSTLDPVEFETGTTTKPIKVENLVGNTTYKVYAIVNGQMTGASVEDDYKAASSANLTATGGIAESNNFLMTGAKSTDVTTGSNVKVYTKDNPLDLGEVPVERAAARFDFKEKAAASPLGANEYSLATTGEKVTLTGVCLINQSKDFYTFKRVSATGTNASWVVGGTETNTNYVVDYNYANKTKAKVTGGSWTPGTYYFAPLNGTTSGTYTAFTTIAANATDKEWKNGSTTDPDKAGGSYHIWTYCTENTIQKTDDNQVNGISTGIVFKGVLSGGAFDGTNEHVYILNNKVLGSWADVVTAATSANPDVKTAYDAVEAALGAGFDESSTGFVSEVAKAGFTRYTGSGTAGSYTYDVYYIYWNRHNDNGKDNVMGPMEFAVVRNNVYKLAVTDITGFGHPNDPTNPGTDPDPDPDEPTPGTPDELSDLYLKLTIKVLPWTVRKNDIKF